MRQIILDTETTGLSAAEGHRIIEVAGVELINRRFTGNHYHQYICPERAIDAEAIAVHGITNAFLADKPRFQTIAEELLQFLAGAELVIHNAPFDVSFLDSEFKLAGAHFKSISQCCSILDTLALARKKHPGQQNNLDALCRRYKVDNTGRDLHGALVDAHLLAQVYLAMTGGQTSLFGGELDVEHQKTLSPSTISATKSKTSLPLRVVQANEQELNAHGAYMEKLRKGGTCIWEM